MKYLILIFFLLTTSQTRRTHLSFSSEEQEQFSIHIGQAVDQFLADKELQKIFPIDDFFYSSTRFWFLIYTYFDDKKLVIHDRSNLNLIYHIQDFSSLDSKNVHPYAQSFIQDKLIRNKMQTLKENLLLLAQDPLPKNSELSSLYNLVLQSGVVVGTTAQEQKQAFTNLAKNLRTQRGLKNHIEAGLTRYNLYSHFLDQYFMDHQLPKELVAISFLESSFNPYAHSKSRAAGVWQFMPFLQRSFFPDHKKIDYRLNIGISSIAAAKLLKENYKILRHWDLAVTAYNSGIKHILTEKRANPTLDLEHLIKKSGHSSFGFASKNFYAEFLALTRVLKHREKLFPIIDDIEPFESLNFYFTKCDINLNKGFSPQQREQLRSVNHQIKKLKILPKGTLITTDADLSPVFYQKISWNDLLKKKPKEWMNPKKRYNCSTR